MGKSCVNRGLLLCKYIVHLLWLPQCTTKALTAACCKYSSLICFSKKIIKLSLPCLTVFSPISTIHSVNATGKHIKPQTSKFYACSHYEHIPFGFNPHRLNVNTQDARENAGSWDPGRGLLAEVETFTPSGLRKKGGAGRLYKKKFHLRPSAFHQQCSIRMKPTASTIWEINYL